MKRKSAMKNILSLIALMAVLASPFTATATNLYWIAAGAANVPVSVTISGLVINASYTGTISQGANPITITGAATFAGGSFAGLGGSLIEWDGSICIWSRMLQRCGIPCLYLFFGKILLNT